MNVRKHASNANDNFIKYCILLVMILNNRLFKYFDDFCELCLQRVSGNFYIDFQIHFKFY